MPTYRVAVDRNPLLVGTCGAEACKLFGNYQVTFQEAAAVACSEAHCLPAAVLLVRECIRRTVKRYRVETYRVRETHGEITVGAAEFAGASFTSDPQPAA